MIELLESRGMVTYACKGAPRMAKVSLRMDEDEVGMAFGDKAMLGAIIDDVTCICKWFWWEKNYFAWSSNIANMIYISMIISSVTYKLYVHYAHLFVLGYAAKKFQVLYKQLHRRQYG